MCIANQTTHPTSSEIYRNPLTEGSQKVHPTKPCLTKLQPRIRMHCTRVDTHTNWSLNHCKGLQKIIWFNPPYNKNIKSIGREFLHLIDQRFRAGHKLRKICNRNTLKLSYSCMANVQQIIKGHNQAILGNSAQLMQDQA